MKPRFPVIGFTGFLEVGKSTAADGVIAAAVAAKIPVAKFSFAEPGKRMLELIGVPPECLRTEEGKRRPLPEFGGKTGRELMQTLMTDWGRQMVSQDLWVRVCARMMLHSVAANLLLVLDDIRFDNEADVIAGLGGTIIEITRPGKVRGNHPSERGIQRDWIDRFIANDGTVADLQASACAACFAD